MYRKANQSPWNEVGQRIKTKREKRVLRWTMSWGCGESRRRAYHTIGNSLTGRVIGELRYLRRKTTEKIHHMDCTKWQLLAEKQLTCLHPPASSGDCV